MFLDFKNCYEQLMSDMEGSGFEFLAVSSDHSEDREALQRRMPEVILTDAFEKNGAKMAPHFYFIWKKIEYVADDIVAQDMQGWLWSSSV